MIVDDYRCYIMINDDLICTRIFIKLSKFNQNVCLHRERDSQMHNIVEHGQLTPWTYSSSKYMEFALRFKEVWNLQK